MNQHQPKHPQDQHEGMLLIDKPIQKSSFGVIAALRRILGVAKIGHCGTLDPFATGLLIVLVGKKFTRLSDNFLVHDKTYSAELHLGVATDTYDCDGRVVHCRCDLVPTEEQIVAALTAFQGELVQTPPMFSAKKIAGKKLYELARRGITVDRPACPITVSIELIRYAYPKLLLRIYCSKGTYVRSLAHDLGALLGCGAHLSALRREASGPFSVAKAFDGSLLFPPQPSVAGMVALALFDPHVGCC